MLLKKTNEMSGCLVSKNPIIISFAKNVDARNVFGQLRGIEHTMLCAIFSQSKANAMNPSKRIERKEISMAALTDIYEREGLLAVKSFINKTITTELTSQKEGIINTLNQMRISTIRRVGISSIEGISYNFAISDAIEKITSL